MIHVPLTENRERSWHPRAPGDFSPPLPRRFCPTILDIHPPISVWSILDALSSREIRLSARVQRPWRDGFPLGNGSTFPSFTRRVRALYHPPRGFFRFSGTTRHSDDGVWLRSLHPSNHTTSSGAWKKESREEGNTARISIRVEKHAWESGIQRVSDGSWKLTTISELPN